VRTAPFAADAIRHLEPSCPASCRRRATRGETSAVCRRPTHSSMPSGRWPRTCRPGPQWPPCRTVSASTRRLVACRDDEYRQPPLNRTGLSTARSIEPPHARSAREEERAPLTQPLSARPPSDRPYSTTTAADIVRRPASPCRRPFRVVLLRLCDGLATRFEFGCGMPIPYPSRGTRRPDPPRPVFRLPTSHRTTTSSGSVNLDRVPRQGW